MSLTATDGEALVRQLSEIVHSDPPGNDIVAIYFGLFEQEVPGNIGQTPQLYVIGSAVFDPEDSDWACVDDNSWTPAERYFSLPGLAQMDASDWEAVENACADLLTGRQAQISALLGTANGRPVALGWDDGDPVVVFTARS